MATAILDRVLERGRFIHLDGPSGRTRHLKLDETLLPKAERLRISGISGSEFAEPTNLGFAYHDMLAVTKLVDDPIGFASHAETLAQLGQRR